MNIAILGAGVGGQSTAIALLQKGFDVTVYERHAAINDIGAGIVCWPNASFVLQQLDLLDDKASVSGRPVTMQRLSSSGEKLGALDIEKLDNYMGYPSYSIFRKDLMQVLQSRLSRIGTEIKFNHRAIAIESTSNGCAKVFFDNGSQSQADLIIGADGRMHSVCRAYIVGNNKPIYQGFINWVGRFESTQPLFEDMAITDYWGVGERFGVVPITKNKAYWAGALAAAEKGDRNPVLYKQELETLFHKWADPVSKIIRATAVQNINKIYVHDHDPVKPWYKDHVLLIGDAAHACLPTSGQGACQALEDAWHIAELLACYADDLNRFFVAFQNARLEKTTGITLGARQFAASLFNTDPTAWIERNQNSKTSDYDSMVAGMAKWWSSGLPIMR